MYRILRTRLEQGRRTTRFPAEVPALPDRYRGLPELDPGRCPAGCDLCARVCPVDAITREGAGPVELDLGRCLFCLECTRACPHDAIRFTRDYRLATRDRKNLVFSGGPLELAQALDTRTCRLFGRSLKLRQVSAAGCNACEADLNVLGTVVYDIGRFGVQFVASPRHADGLVLTGPVSENMRVGLLKTWEAIPAPKIVVVVGACAISGGPFAGFPEVHDGAGGRTPSSEGLLPVDLYVPGCPPHPLSILDGILRVLDRL